MDGCVQCLDGSEHPPEVRGVQLPLPPDLPRQPAPQVLGDLWMLKSAGSKSMVNTGQL